MGEYCRVHHLDLKVPLSCQAVGGLLNEADPIPRNILVGPNGSTTKPELAASNKQGQTISQPGGVAGIIAWLFRRERGGGGENIVDLSFCVLPLFYSSSGSQYTQTQGKTRRNVSLSHPLLCTPNGSKN